MEWSGLATIGYNDYGTGYNFFNYDIFAGVKAKDVACLNSAAGIPWSNLRLNVTAGNVVPTPLPTASPRKLYIGRERGGEWYRIRSNTTLGIWHVCVLFLLSSIKLSSLFGGLGRWLERVGFMRYLLGVHWHHWHTISLWTLPSQLPLCMFTHYYVLCQGVPISEEGLYFLCIHTHTHNTGEHWWRYFSYIRVHLSATSPVSSCSRWFKVPCLCYRPFLGPHRQLHPGFCIIQG